MTPFRAVLLLITILVSPGLVRGQDGPPETGPQVLRPGDGFIISVWERPEFSGAFKVGAEGVIAHPIFQSVRVAGLSIEAASEQLRQFLISMGETDPRVWIEPVYRVLVTGEVGAPGLVEVGPETTIADAIVLAGGPTERAKIDEVKVIRGTSTFLVSLKDELRSTALIPIHSGDQIELPRRREIFRGIVLPAVQILGTLMSLLTVYDRFVIGR